jgi:hypothetical protein
MWDTCKGWWEGKIKVEVDEVLLLHRSRGDSVNQFVRQPCNRPENPKRTARKCIESPDIELIWD